MEKDKLALLEIISRIEGELQNLKELKSELNSIKNKKGVIYKPSKKFVEEIKKFLGYLQKGL